MNRYLFTPGPVPVPSAFASRDEREMISHREEVFFELMELIQSKLRSLLKTEGPVIILPSSGTGALEALVNNYITAKDRVLSVSCGQFGERFREIAGRTEAEIIPLDSEPGRAIDAGSVADAVIKDPDISVVLLTHNETSTGVLNPLQPVIEAIPDNGPLVLVDAVSSLGSTPCFPEELGIDGLASCSQKGLMTPPGLGFVWLSDRGWDLLESKKEGKPCYYFDLKLHRKYLEKERPQNPFTPPVSLLKTLNRSLGFILDKGLENWFASKRRFAASFIEGTSKMGMAPFVRDSEVRSPGVSAVIFDRYAESVRKNLAEMGVVVGGGQGRMKNSILRFAHYADTAWPDLALLLGSIYGSLDLAGYHPYADFMRAAWKRWNGGEF